jgi:hypothetical protein
MMRDNLNNKISQFYRKYPTTPGERDDDVVYNLCSLLGILVAQCSDGWGDVSPSIYWQYLIPKR